MANRTSAPASGDNSKQSSSFKYGDMTQKLLAAMATPEFSYHTDNDQVYIKDKSTGEELVLPQSYELARNIIEEGKQEGETLAQFAARCGVTSSALSNITYWNIVGL